VNVTGLVLFLLMAAPAEEREPGVVFPPQRKGNITATLEVRVPAQGPGPGRGRVQLTINVRGPRSLEVDGPQLEDALAGWQTQWAASSWSSGEGEADWEQSMELVQVKPGVVPLPGVTLRVRDGPSAGWEEMSWPDLLNEPRDVPGPEQLPPLPPSPWPRLLVVLGTVLAAGLGLALLVRVGRRWRAAGERPLPAHERALARLGAMPAEPGAAVLHLDGVLRGYLEERFGVEAMRKTTREVMAALPEKPALSEQETSDLAELLAWCDMAKFAGISQGTDVREAYEQTGRFVRATSPGEEKRDGEERKSGENQIPDQGG
jgi:hypothetical protein